MFEDQTICPYPGLRPFTEEESLYFKGRENQIIDLTGLLEEKKFLMVTGASGDGKSSLIYAGLIPQARAGFFKADYSNWYVAGFRAERSPMKNIATSLAQQLQMDSATIEVELSRGFSSLVELYKSSSLYIDKKSKVWQALGVNDRDQLERRAGNLLIIIDQFEEFFTNPENFPQGVPSQDSRLLLNIILETCKISLRENLPIYVVCTMRSDYIGQCAAFRGLPEFIGFSQFFVPRLQRKELQQVIEEPAILSGNRISKRLTDRLIFDLEEGLDQLPIVQHALKQIWKAADSGREEMDLIHYAMVGGMDGEKLPKEDLVRFNSWIEKIPDYEKSYLSNPALANVLDIHANKLYEEAAACYNERAEIPLTNKEAKLIIGLAFSCLTRIDESRAVRNRMTLEEITHIINVPKLTTHVVSGVMNIFREPENTLVRPFLEDSDNKTAKSLGPQTVLDITHEALIRNWKLLKKWSDQESQYHAVFLDLKQQVTRWIDSGKSSDYLLPIGPLTYFEKWYTDCRPNKYWINRYNEREAPAPEKLKESESTLHDLQKFLRKSALQLTITRTFMKYGAARIAAVAAVVLLLGLGSFIVYSWHIRKNEVVISKLIKEGASLLNNKETAAEWKAYFVLFASRIDTANISIISQQVTDNQTKIEIALKIFERLFFTNKTSDPPIRGQALAYADSLIHLSDPLATIDNVQTFNNNLVNLNDLIRNESYYLSVKPDEKMRERLNRNVKHLGKVIVRILTAPSISSDIDIKALNIGIENCLNFKGLDSDQITDLISSVSPFGKNREAGLKFEKIFPLEGKLNVGLAETVSHNGGYEKLAYFYAAQGDVQRVLRCLDSLNKHNETYDLHWNNSANIGGYFLMYGHSRPFQDLIKAYSKAIGVQQYIFVKTMVNQAGILELRRIIKFIQHGNYNENLALFDFNLVKELFGIYKATIEEEIKDKNELHFNLALLHKHQGVVYERILREKGVLSNSNLTDSLFSIALEHYSNLPSEFLQSSVEVYAQPALVQKEKRMMKRSQLFLYPDHFKLNDAFTFVGFFRYYGDAFFNYMIHHDLFTRYYRVQDDYELLITWVNSYFELYGVLSGAGGVWNRAALNYPPLSDATLLSVDSILVRSGYSNALDDAWINLKLAKDYFDSGDTLRAFERIRKLKFLAFTKTYFTEESSFHNMLLNVAKELAIHGKRSKAISMISQFSNTKNKAAGYSKLAAYTRMNKQEDESKVYLDSSLAALNRVKFFRNNFEDLGFDYRTGLVEILTLQDNASNRRQAHEHVRDMELVAKLNGVLAMVRTQARMGQYFNARSSIPELANPEDRLRCIIAILYVDVLKNSDVHESAWSKFDKDLLEWVNYTEFVYDLFEY